MFDAHTHVFPPSQIAAREALAGRDNTFAELYADPSAGLATGPELVKELERARFDGAFAAGFAFAGESDLQEQNEYLVGFAAESAGRAMALVTCNPSLAGWEKTLLAGREAGAIGAGELRPRNQSWEPLGPDGQVLCSIAGELGLLLLWHVSEPVGHRYPGKAGGISPVEILELAALFPEVKMIAAHLGGGAAYYLSIPEVRAAVPNLYFDTAASSLLYDDEAVPRLVELAGPGRVLFGSDYPLQSVAKQASRIRELLPAAVADAVCGGSAQSLVQDLRPS